MRRSKTTQTAARTTGSGLRAWPRGRGGCASPGRRAFTLVELLVVIAVIGLILAIAVPGISNMGGEARQGAAVQMLSGAFTRAYYLSQSDAQMMAIRIMPGAWDYEEKTDAQRPQGRQHLVTYSYVGTTDREQGSSGNYEVAFGETFQRRPGNDSVNAQLPADVWAAPLEAWRDPPGWTGQSQSLRILDGTVGKFELDPDRSGEKLLEADDFLVVFDPQTGLRRDRSAFQLRAYDPNRKRDVEDDGTTNVNRARFLRYNTAGVVVYRREPFALQSNSNQERQQTLRSTGRPYFIHRYGGGLVMGSPQ